MEARDLPHSQEGRSKRIIIAGEYPARRVKSHKSSDLHDVRTDAIQDTSTEKDMEMAATHQAEQADIRKIQDPPEHGTDHGSAAEDEDGPGTLVEQKTLSKEMEANIHLLRQKVEQFTQQVSGLLDTGKAYFLDASNAFEEGIVQLHQKLVEKWEEQIEELRTLDASNEDIRSRLGSARELVAMIQSQKSPLSSHLHQPAECEG